MIPAEKSPNSSNEEWSHKLLTQAKAALDVGAYDEARTLSSALLKRMPKHAGALSIMAASYYQQNNLPEAATYFERVLSVLQQRETQPELLAQAAHNLASVHDSMGLGVSAEDYYRYALLLHKNRPETLIQLGGLLRQQGRLDEAIQLHQHGLALYPERADMAYALACSFHQSGRLDEAMRLHRRALELQPDMHMARSNLATCHLLRGDFSTGWDLYEYRWQSSQMNFSWLHLPVPLWSGEPLDQKNLLVWAEQGLGDNIQFVRYLAMLRERYPKAGLIFLTPPSLIRLFTPFAQYHQIALIPWQNMPAQVKVEGIDCHIPLLGLPRLLNTRLETIPSKTPAYLALDPSWKALWQARIAALDEHQQGRKPQRTIGLVWRGHLQGIAAPRRNMRLSMLTPWLDVPGIRWISLQVGEGVIEEIASTPWRTRLIDWTAELKDFADTASLSAVLDQVIAVDTSTAHAAAAVDTPVWMLSRFDACWRWLEKRTDSPWYPSMRIYRQPQPGDWHAVVAAVHADLHQQNNARSG